MSPPEQLDCSLTSFAANLNRDLGRYTFLLPGRLFGFKSRRRRCTINGHNCAAWHCSCQSSNFVSLKMKMENVADIYSLTLIGG